MKKPLVIVIIVAGLIAAGLFIYNNFMVPSPPGETTFTSGDLVVSVSYSRPSVRDRLIFGERGQQALQPYGEYWRLGANAATEITVSRDVLFNNEPLKAGTYRMYAIPGAESFEIVLNTELGASGSEEPDPALDILRTTVPADPLRTPVEQFTITMEASANGLRIIFEWADVRLVVPVALQ